MPAGIPPEYRPHHAPLRADKRKHRLTWQLIFIALGLLIALAGVSIAAFFTYQNIYSPGAFVSNYAGMLAHGQTAQALQVPGVSPSAQAEPVSDALLRSTAIAKISDIHVVSQEEQSDGSFLVTLGYRSGGENLESVFSVVQQGQRGVAPVWAFAHSPLAVLDLSLSGSLRFTVNNFELDARNIAPDPADYVPGDPLEMLVFTPGSYSLSVDTAISTAEPSVFFATAPGETIEAEISATPSDELHDQVQDSLNTFLNDCAAQPVLQPSGCPFGFHIRNRVETTPVWQIVEYPELALVPSEGYWKISESDATAQLKVQIRMLQDGSLVDLNEIVPFVVSGKVLLGPDGNPVVRVSGHNQAVG